MADSKDRRSLRTRRALTAALMDLMRDRRYDAITIQQITDRADVGRSTFYAHFTGKDDLLADGVRFLVASFAESEPRPELALLRHLGVQAELYQVMARSRALPVFLSALHDELATRLTRHLQSRVPPGREPELPPPLLAAMVTGMFLTMVRSWLETGAHEPAEALHHMFQTVSEPAIEAGLRGQKPGTASAVGL
ncbi:TetR/AcrR family transcriptional regulator [Actinomadura macrotermitis]|uniref:HTH tetR-type domain-containing protein n=1 Tax=Actinomadura macrotermitis TaxID=2585200 RepID=A0A7K0BLP4_9ACTN|nr:TetR/AcrR family transcriptional regulator [Actinomadura macrotermitis]MQY02097.1 hypothetical protein [Actinomadura macrotermitis]